MSTAIDCAEHDEALMIARSVIYLAEHPRVPEHDKPTYDEQRMARALLRSEANAKRYLWLKGFAKESSDGWEFPGVQGAPSLETLDQVIDATINS